MRRAIWCLTRPLTLTTILLLLLNDFVLKAVVPSWFTGKLSDFAGLYFFPFLLAVLLFAVARPRHHLQDAIFNIALVCTAIVFSSIKLFEPANLAARTILSALFRAPVPIALDPTDLLALTMLWPAWRLWRRASDAPVSRAVAHATILVAAFASIASSPPAPIRFTGRVQSVDTFFAMETTTGAISYPFVRCSQKLPNWCFQVERTARVWESLDGGQTFRMTWPKFAEYQDALNRLNTFPRDINYSQKFQQQSDPGSFAVDTMPTLGAFDIAFGDINGQYVAAVAVGNYGTLVKSRDGAWHQIHGPNGLALPASIVSKLSPSSLLFMFPVDSLIIHLLSIVLSAMILNRTAMTLQAGGRETGIRAAKIVFLAVMGVTTVALSVPYDSLSYSNGLMPFGPFPVSALAFLSVSLVPICIFRGSDLAGLKRPRSEVLVTCFGTLNLLICAFAPLVGWLDGRPPSLWVARAISAVLCLVAFAIVWRVLVRNDTTTLALHESPTQHAP